ncbi:MAG TPA: XdhC family protein [Limnochordia bacterium]
MADATVHDLAVAERAGIPAVVATVVAVRGSTPRRPGARMLIWADGRTAGTIGGGCGEAEVRQAALDVIDTGRARLFTVDLLGGFGDDREVCGGIMEVFIEPIGAAERPTGGGRSAEPA